jgi:hypothetical protein
VQAPFTTEQFMEVMLRYNDAVWPMQIALYLLAAALVYLAARGADRGDRWVAGMLAFLWAWMGIAYHWVFFTAINPAAWVFGAFFVLQAALFLLVGVSWDRLRFSFEPDVYGWTGAVFLLYALVAYPILGGLAGHGFPDGPTFGLPCPTTIATFGVLLWAVRRVPGWLVAIPAIWSLIGTGAALQFGIPEDYGLLVAGVVGTVLVLLKNRRLARLAASAPAQEAQGGPR